MARDPVRRTAMNEAMNELPFGSITDVDGITVGHHQRTGRGWQTGTTVVLALDGATPGVDVRGGGPGTRETDALAPQNLIDEIHAICLTGGSAYGLAAAHGVMTWLEARGIGYPVGPPGASSRVVPVVPAAVIFDLERGGTFGHRPDASFGERAAGSARRSQSKWGSVGAGSGAVAGGLQGGVGTASTVVSLPVLPVPPVFPGDDDDDPDATLDASIDAGAGVTVEVTVGALVVVNANGSVIDPTTALPWLPSGLGLRRPSRSERRALTEATTADTERRLNTTIGVVATSARLTKAEASKLASVAHDGLARAVRPAHSMFDGDTIFGLATGVHELGDRGDRARAAGSRQQALNTLLVAGADTFAAACTHAVIAATTLGTARAYRDLCRSALR